MSILENIYYRVNSEITLEHYEDMFNTLFSHFLNDLKNSCNKDITIFNSLTFSEKRKSLFIFNIEIIIVFIFCISIIFRIIICIITAFAVISEIALDDTISGIIADSVIFYRSDSGVVKMRLEAPVPAGPRSLMPTGPAVGVAEEASWKR